jgi:uncharacterized protein (TIRG00374 family)
VKNAKGNNKESKRQIWSTCLRLIICVAILWFIISRIDLSEVYRLMKLVDLKAFVLTFLVNIVIHLFFILRWRRILQALQTEAKFQRLASFHFIGLFFNLFIPTAIGGDVIKAYYNSKETGNKGASYLSVFLDRYIGLLVIIGLAAIAACSVGLTVNGVAVYFWVLLIFIVAVLMTVLLSTNFAQFLNRILGTRLKSLHSVITTINESSKATLRNRGVMIWSFLMTLGVVLLTVVINYIFINSIGKSVDFKDILIFIPIIIFAASFPISIAGLGVREGAYIFLFATIGFTNEESLSLSLLNFALLFLISLPGAIIYLFAGRRKTSTPAP